MCYEVLKNLLKVEIYLKHIYRKIFEANFDELQYKVNQTPIFSFIIINIL